MPKPTSPQPLGLTDEECDRLATEAWTQAGAWREPSPEVYRAMVRAGCEAQRKVDAEIARWHIQCAKKAGGLDDEDVRECAKEITEAIERTPEQPTTKRCGTCGSDDPGTSYTDDGIATTPQDLSPGVCHGPFHSQPTKCGTCGSPDLRKKIPLSLMGGEMWCEDAWHYRPTTGEADNPADDPSIPIEEIRGD